MRLMHRAWAAVGILAAGQAASPVSAIPAKSGPDPQTMQLQVALDRLGFSPGVIDGRRGFSLGLAISGFQEANGLPATGKPDRKTTAAVAALHPPPALAKITLTREDLTGPFTGPLPRGEMAQAKLPALGYANALEMLSERYHTTPEVLIALNSPSTRMAPGTVINVPNVATTAHDYPVALPADYKATLAGLNVPSGQPQADHLTLSKAKRSLSAYDAKGGLIARFPVTTGSSHDPLPLGHWKIVGASYNPEFHYNPKLFWDAKKGDRKATLPPGPNGPVGIVWLDLSKPHYGIHGTPEPQNIGRTESHGCVRLTNWDAGRLSLMVKPGTPAVFEK